MPSSSPFQMMSSPGLFIAMLSELESPRTIMDADTDFSTQIYSLADVN